MAATAASAAPPHRVAEIRFINAVKAVVEHGPSTLYHNTLLSEHSIQRKFLDHEADSTGAAAFLDVLSTTFPAGATFAVRMFELAHMFALNQRKRFPSGSRRNKLNACMAAGHGFGGYVVHAVYLSEFLSHMEDYCNARVEQADQSQWWDEQAVEERKDLWTQRGESITGPAEQYEDASMSIVTALSVTDAAVAATNLAAAVESISGIEELV